VQGLEKFRPGWGSLTEKQAFFSSDLPSVLVPSHFRQARTGEDARAYTTSA
jgi:hypothetical protein